MNELTKMAKRAKRLRGHTLWNGGFGGTACTDNGFNLVDATGTGYAFCECGAHSGELPDEGERKRWHRRHQRAVKAALASGKDGGE